MGEERELDVVLYGATGFVGRLTSQYLASKAPEGTRIGLAGRSRPKLESLKAELGPAAAGWPLFVADSGDREALADFVGRTRAVATTVGPYRRYGMPLAQACAEAGTHYADLSGEVLFMRQSIDALNDTAARTGARIVHCCGFDSIPSDLGALLLHEAARSTGGSGQLGETLAAFGPIRGGVSGGTIASLKGQIDEVRSNSDLRRLALDPYALSPDREQDPPARSEPDPMGPRYEPELGAWTAPFIMSMINTRVVRRSNALTGYRYGRNFRYREVMATGRGPLGLIKAAGVAAGLGALVGGLALKPTRILLDRFLPDPGEGPSEKAQREGHFTLTLRSRTPEGQAVTARVAAPTDPGYSATAVMLAESALALALDGESLPDVAGVLTTATAMGTALIERLRRAGHTYEAEVVRAGL